MSNKDSSSKKQGKKSETQHENVVVPESSMQDKEDTVHVQKITNPDVQDVDDDSNSACD